MVVSGRYDSNTKTVILVLSNGQEISFSVADLISGLQSEITIDNKLSVQLIDGLGTAALKDVPTSGNASATQVVLGNDGRLAWMDTNGDIYFGATRIARVMDEDSYTDLATKEKIYYLIYPTPTDNRSLSVNLQNSGIDNMRGEPEEENKEINELEEPIEEELIEETPEPPPDDDMR